MSRTTGGLRFDHFGCFGKLPLSREFIVEGPSALAGSGLESWIGDGNGLAKARLGSRFNDLVKQFPRYRFCWSFGGDAILAGVVQPSQDGAGRKHPISLFGLLRGKADSAAALALELANLQEQSSALLDAATVVDSAAALRELVQSARPVPGDTTVSDNYDRFLAAPVAATFWDRLARDGRDGGDGRDQLPFVLLQGLIETLAPLRSCDSRAFRGGIRFPLTAGAQSDTALEAALWLALTERFLGRPLGNNWWFRAADGANDAACYLFLFLSPPSPNQWISLLDPASDLESISYLDRPYGSVSARERMNPELRALLENDSATLGDFLRFNFQSL